MSKSYSVVWGELESHLPYSVFATAAGILLAGIMLYVAIVVTSARSEAPGHVHERTPAAEADHASGGHDHASHAEITRGGAAMQEASHVTFHVFHGVHMLFSAIATTAMFWRYERKLLKAILTGLIGSLGVCGVSDILMPYASGLILGAKHMTFHWCLVEHPMLVLPFAVVGVFVGLLAAETIQRSTYFSHSAHVVVSSAASIFYLVSFGLTDWVEKLGYVFILMVLAVMLPCCVSDIVFPLVVVCKNGKGCACPAHHRHEEQTGAADGDRR